MIKEDYDTLSIQDLNKVFKIGLDNRAAFHLKSGEVIRGKIIKEITEGIIPIGFVISSLNYGVVKVPVTSIEFIGEEM